MVNAGVLATLALPVLAAAASHGSQRLHKVKRGKISDRTAYAALVTWGEQNGNQGACGFDVKKDSDALVGISTYSFTDDVCGKWVKITGDNGKTAVAQVTDSCTPSPLGVCAGEYDLYLSPAVFQQLGYELDAGVFNGTWTLTEAPSNPSAVAKKVSSAAADAAKSTSAAIAKDPVGGVQAYQPPYTPEASPAPAPAEKPAEKPASKEVAAPAPAPAPATSSAVATPPKSPAPGSVDGCKFGFAWAVDDRWMPAAEGARDGFFCWYHHWERGAALYATRGLKFYPMAHSEPQFGAFDQVMGSLGYTPEAILGFNEIDLMGYSTDQLVQQWWAKMQPYSSSLLISPSITFNIDMLADFINKCQGCKIDGIQVHSYQDYSDGAVGHFIDFISKVHQRFPQYDVWITEAGLTASSNPSVDQVKGYLAGITQWVNNTGYVKKFSWFGCFSPSTIPDSFTTTHDAFFNNDGSVTEVLYSHVYAI